MIKASKPSPDEFDGPRACGPYELAPCLDNANLVMRVHATPSGQPPVRPTVGFDWCHIYHHENLANIRVIAHNGRVVSSVAIFPGTVRTLRGNISVGGINCFATHPDYRRQGLGEAILLDAHQKMKENGHHIGLLSTGIHDYYRKYGWESAGKRRTYWLDRGNIDLLLEPADYDVTENWKPYVDQMYDLHHRKHVVSSRSTELFNLLIEHRLDRVFLATRGGDLLAYVGFRANVVYEYAGPPNATASLIRHGFRADDDPNASTTERLGSGTNPAVVEVRTPDLQEDLPDLLSTAGIPHQSGYIGMFLILDPQGLFEALNIHEVALEHENGSWRLRRDSKTLKLTERGLAKLIFGPERYPGFAPGIFPIDFYQWPLDMV